MITCSSWPWSASTAPGVCAEAGEQPDVLAEERPEHPLQPGDDLVQAQHLPRHELLPAEAEELPGELLRPVRRLPDLFRVGPPGIVRLQRRQEEVAEAEDDHHHVVEVVRHAAGEPAHRFHLLRLAHLLFGTLPLGEILHVLQTAKQKQVNAIMTTALRSFFAERKRIVELAGKYRLPAIYPNKGYVDEGGLMSYGEDSIDQYRQAAGYVDKILKGAKPADLPVQQATKFEFIINLKAAKQIGLTIPVRVLERANQVIR